MPDMELVGDLHHGGSNSLTELGQARKSWADSDLRKEDWK